MLAEWLSVHVGSDVFNSPLACSISLYPYLARPHIEPWPFLSAWVFGWVVYLVSRFVAGMVFSLRPPRSTQALPFWSRLSILIQALGGLFIARCDSWGGQDQRIGQQACQQHTRQRRGHRISRFGSQL